MSISILGHYDKMIEGCECAKEVQKNINSLINEIRKEGVAEPILLELESEIEYIFSQYKGTLVSEFKAKSEVDELNEKLNQIKTLVNEEL